MTDNPTLESALAKATEEREAFRAACESGLRALAASDAYAEE